MRDPDRPTNPPPPRPRPRDKQASVRDADVPGDRELYLRAIHEASETTKRELLEALEQRFQQSQRVSIGPTRTAWKSAAFKLLVALGALLTALATYLGARASQLQPKVETQEVRTTVTETKTDDTATKVAGIEGRLVMLEQRVDEKTLWDVELWAEQGVLVRRPDRLRSKAVTPLEIVVPQRPKPGHMMTVNTPPP